MFVQQVGTLLVKNCNFWQALFTIESTTKTELAHVILITLILADWSQLEMLHNN